jgi:hypothetical protein
MGGTSRISREAYVRLCERLGVKFPGATRRSAGDRRPYADLVAFSDKWAGNGVRGDEHQHRSVQWTCATAYSRKAKDARDKMTKPRLPLCH